MKDQTSSLLVVAIIGIAIIGLGSYLVTQETPLPADAYSTTVEPDGAYVYEERQELTEYPYTEKERFATAVETQISELTASLEDLGESADQATVRARQELDNEIESLRLQLAQARASGKEDWELLTNQIATTAENARMKLNNLSH